MSNNEADIKPAITAGEDRGDSIGLMEPLLLSEDCRLRPALIDLALELAQKSAGFRRSLPNNILTSLAGLVRSMNCYYSNLIEGHDTHPIDIERALKNDYSADKGKRNLQLEAKAHIAVQKWIDEGGVKAPPVTAETVCEIHRRFYEEMPDELRWVEDPTTKERLKIIPGVLRHRDVKVGLHIGISPGAVPRFLKRFEDVFTKLGKTETVLATAAVHHRLVWIHPFLDGNGRVVRLMSHATLLKTLDTGAVWSIARGLARNVQDYKTHLANCDMSRRNDLDGRGTLSEEALARFTEFFLKTCIDQVAFMENLVQPDRLRARILLWVEEEIRLGNLPAKSGSILDALLYRGELPRSEISEILGVGERQGRRIIAMLGEKEVISSESSRAPIHLAFPASLASRWMPGLFPEKT
jgi:Fic family protein